MAFLIDLTDGRFKIPANRAVIEYIRRENPFAHSDVGALLMALWRRVPGAQYYCPSFSSLAYVVLHTPANVIFAIAIGMHKIDFRLPYELVTEAIESGEAEPSAIGQPGAGSAWLSCRPFSGGEPKALIDTRLKRWCEAAYQWAQESSGGA
ncbi:MAG TPA: hypothetical protein VKT12_00220 [Candidatus Binataceae bacterium]|jgi:hypothetical protein|nr:hypothetical protein [Candidatus Binataceae bacterium]